MKHWASWIYSTITPAAIKMDETCITTPEIIAPLTSDASYVFVVESRNLRSAKGLMALRVSSSSLESTTAPSMCRKHD